MKLVKVDNIKTQKYSGSTHDLEVGGENGSHSYVVRPHNTNQDGLVVHNSVCTTRLVAGVGYPQLSAVIECADAAHGLGGHIIADGGCASPGDVAKAFAAGADFVMLGGMLAGHDQGGGEVITKFFDTNEYEVGPMGERTKVVEERKFVQFYGMSSKSANDKHFGGLKDYRSSEGRTVLTKYRGDVNITIQDILGGVRSACTYAGASKLKYLSKCATFIRCTETHNRIFESSTIGN
jgi:GMP reductase